MTATVAEPTPAPTPAPAPEVDPLNVWINEFHYDNASSDTGEFFEVAGSAGLELDNYRVVMYNGSNGATYGADDGLSSGTASDEFYGVPLGTAGGTFSEEAGGIGVVSVGTDAGVNGYTSLQNGSPDGLALIYVADAGAPDAAADESAWGSATVIEFICYEGTLTATNGPANGTDCVDIGVSQSSSTAAGSSLGKTGSGDVSTDFTWEALDDDTPGNANTGQTFSDE
tara:strand:- start:499 stop:1179 length:681 start_codon:yes stop_codon:yes gene_type:complete